MSLLLSWTHRRRVGLRRRKPSIRRPAVECLEERMVLSAGSSAAFGDIDGDADLDVFINNMSDVPTFLVDEARHRNHWIRLTLVGARANRDALGVPISLEVDGRKLFRDSGLIWTYLSTNDRRVTVGLGASEAASNVVLSWPSGKAVLGTLRAGEDVLIKEGIGRMP